MTDDVTYRAEPDPAFADHLEHVLVNLLDVPLAVPTSHWTEEGTTESARDRKADVADDHGDPPRLGARRRPVMVVAVAVALVIALGAALLLRRREAEDHPSHETPTSGLIALVGDYKRAGGSGFYDFVSDIYVVEPDGSGLRAVTSTPALNEISPAWSPDGSQLAFLRDVHRGSAQLVVIDPYTGAQKLDATVPMHSNTDPAVPVWAPDGRSIMVQIGNDHNKLINLDTKEWTTYHQGVSFSPDGKWVLVPSVNGLLELTLLPADQLPTVKCCDAAPPPGGRIVLRVDSNTRVQWTPDSSALTITSSDRRIDLMTIADGHRRTLLRDAANPSWSPSGRQIAFLRNFQPGAGTGAEVWVASAYGSNAHRVATSSVWPTWSADGEVLILAGADGLFTVRPDGTDAHVISRDFRFQPSEFYAAGDFDPTQPHEWPSDMFGPVPQSMTRTREDG